MDEIVSDEEGKPERLELYAAAASKKLIEERAAMLKRAGYRLKVVIPSQMAYTRLLIDYLTRNPIEDGLHQVFINIGYEHVSVQLFKGSKFKASKTIDFGCRDLDAVIADIKNVDRHVASTYKASNFEGAETIGVTAGASTPQAQIDEVCERICELSGGELAPEGER